MRQVYMDHAATTYVKPQVFEAMRPYFTETFGNPSSLHSFGREAASAVDEGQGTGGPGPLERRRPRRYALQRAAQSRTI